MVLVTEYIVFLKECDVLPWKSCYRIFARLLGL